MYNQYHKQNYDNLKINFNGRESLNEFYSQAAQDIFVLTVLEGKRNGTFLDIGASDPIFISNTYLLEKYFGWSGVLVEIDKALADKCKSIRSSEVICDNAVNVDYRKIFNELNNIDYVSLDIDGTPTLDVLKKLPLDTHKISVITFEHELYRVGTVIKNESKRILESYGYIILCDNVANQNNIYEDWYVHPDLVDINKFKLLQSSNKNWNDILFV